MVKWYQNSISVLGFSLFLAGMGWMFHAVFEAFFFQDRTFLQIFITNVTTHDVILRIIVGGCFFIFGLLLSKTIAERHRTEQQLQDAYEALRRANDDLESRVKERTGEVDRLLKQKTNLILNLSHDLKTPLTPLMGLLPMMMREEKDEKLKDLLQLCNRNVCFIRDLVSKTIDLALLDSSIVGFTIEKTHLLTEINQILEDRQYLLKDHEIYVENNINDTMYVLADRIRIREVLNNLITNSVKFTPEKGGMISIDGKEKNNMIIVSVKDTGIGLTSDQLTHIFEELYKADDARHDHASTGLGLSICKRIVEKHGGTIWAESAGPGKGTTIFFSIPAAVKEERIDTFVSP